MARPGLILIGYWRHAAGDDSPADKTWPSPADLVDPTWDDDERELVTDYLQRGFVARAYMGYSPCRLCGCDNGSFELSDDVYVWPDGLAHYLQVHGVRLPQPFVSHVRSRIETLETADRDESWWRNTQGWG